MKGCVFEIREFCVHDGPGVRTTVFFKGCPLRCLWCQNPEGLAFEPELLVNDRPCIGCGRCAAVCPTGRRRIVGEWMAAADVAARLLRDREFFADSGGGVTFSGGEPLAQPEFLFELCGRLSGIHKAIETSGFAPSEVYAEMLRNVDLVFQDLKHSDPERHRELTGQDNLPILNNLKLLKQSGKPFIARLPLIPGANADAENLRNCAALLAGAPNLLEVQLLPYNPAAPAKYRSAGRNFPLELPDNPVPYDEFRDLFVAGGLPCAVL
jgi:pyruvate formate lyase activating enzyme